MKNNKQKEQLGRAFLHLGRVALFLFVLSDTMSSTAKENSIDKRKGNKNECN